MFTPKKLNMAAVDLGASGGRVITGEFDGQTLRIKEAGRFPNLSVSVNGTLYWDILHFYTGIRQGLKMAGDESDGIDGIGIDSWGNDFGLLDQKGRLLSNPVHYRDGRTLGMMEKVFEIVPRESVFRQTGIQFMRFNALYQLFSMLDNREPVMKIASAFLMIPDLIVYFLTGQRINEYTNATTTQMLDPYTSGWAAELMGALGINKELFTDVVKPGMIIGKLTDENENNPGIKNARVIAVAEHDTASAVIAVPAKTDDFVYISSGTWSLIGVETKKPVINDLTYNYNFTNEGGAFGTYIFYKVI